MSTFMVQLLVVVVILAAVTTALAFASVVTVREGQRGVVLTLGRFAGIRKPGIRFILPVLQQMELVDIRERVVDVPRQEVITKDNIPVTINGIVYYRVVNPYTAILETEDFAASTREMAQSILRSCGGGKDLDSFANPKALSREVQSQLALEAESWGVCVSNVEIKDIEIDPAMVQGIAQQAIAERNRRSVIVNAEGEQTAAVALARAAQILSQSPGAMQLRYLQTLAAIAGAGGTTIVFPFPTDLKDMMPDGKVTDAIADLDSKFMPVPVSGSANGSANGHSPQTHD